MFAKRQAPSSFQLRSTSTTLRTDNLDGYAATADRMEELAKEQPGYLGFESARSGLGIAVSYWVTDDDARAWKQIVGDRSAVARDVR